MLIEQALDRIEHRGEVLSATNFILSIDIFCVTV